MKLEINDRVSIIYGENNCILWFGSIDEYHIVIRDGRYIIKRNKENDL